MPLVIADRVLETTNSPGTGAITLLGAASGYQSFSSAIGSGNTTYYTIADQSGTNWEVGLGTLTNATTLARTTVLASSNSGNAVNFSSGLQNVWVDYPSSQAVLKNSSPTFSSVSVANANGNGQISVSAGGPTVISSTATDPANAGLLFVVNGSNDLTIDQDTFPKGGTVGQTSGFIRIPSAAGDAGTPVASIPNTAPLFFNSATNTLSIYNQSTNTWIPFAFSALTDAGTAGQVFTSNGAGAAASWTDVQNGLLSGVGYNTAALPNGQALYTLNAVGGQTATLTISDDGLGDGAAIAAYFTARGSSAVYRFVGDTNTFSIASAVANTNSATCTLVSQVNFDPSIAGLTNLQIQVPQENTFVDVAVTPSLTGSVALDTTLNKQVLTLGLNPPTATVIGGVKAGANITIAPDGTISATGGFREWRAGGLQLIPSGSDTIVLYDTVVTTVGNIGLTLSGGVFTNNTGAQLILDVSYQVAFSQNATGSRATFICLGSTLTGNRRGVLDLYASTDFPVLSSSAKIVLAAGGSFFVGVWQNSGTNVNINGNYAGMQSGQSTFIQVQRILS